MKLLVLPFLYIGVLGFSPFVECREDVVAGREARGLFNRDLSHIKEKLVDGANSVFKKFGILECNGIDRLTSGKFSHIFGTSSGGPSFGNKLCSPTCDGGCVPYQNLAEASTTISYAFGCQCHPKRCGSHGPIPEKDQDANYEIVCKRDDTCSCSGVGTRDQHTGYLCNWINIDKEEKVTFSDVGQYEGSAAILPVAWCACCPRT